MALGLGLENVCVGSSLHPFDFLPLFFPVRLSGTQGCWRIGLSHSGPRLCLRLETWGVGDFLFLSDPLLCVGLLFDPLGTLGPPS